MQRIHLLFLSLFFVAVIPSLKGFSVKQAHATSHATATTAVARAAIPRGSVRDFGIAPVVPERAMNMELREAMAIAFGEVGHSVWGEAQAKALNTIRDSDDPRPAWLIADLMRFVANPSLSLALTQTLNKLLGVQLDPLRAWNQVTDRLIAWDIPAPENYLVYKRHIFTSIVPEWERLFTAGDIDWRHVSWGGVGIDDRAFGTTDTPCNCIPAADNPPVIKADDAKWLQEGDIIFGIGINGEYRAYPRQIMEVREMVNDTLGGRDLGIPYCTLCGSAQAWFTDNLPDGVKRPVLRTSGLLIRSNKVMYDLNTYTVFDTFRGHAVAGPLAEKGIKLEQASVITTTWGAWKAAHPETTVLKESLALGRNFDFRNGRDANGPIFPIGDVDPRLAVQEDVLGVLTASGEPVAFHVPSLITALDAGETVKVYGVEVIMDARGVRAVDDNGKDLGTHQAFWFAWSQFYPGTTLWPE